MNIPAELRYSSDHEWIRQDGNTVTIGITEFAQDSLGDVVFVEAEALLEAKWPGNVNNFNFN